MPIRSYLSSTFSVQLFSPPLSAVRPRRRRVVPTRRRERGLRERGSRHGDRFRCVEHPVALTLGLHGPVARLLGDFSLIRILGFVGGDLSPNRQKLGFIVCQRARFYYLIWDRGASLFV